MLSASNSDTNTCIRAILDEYYEVESLGEMQIERRNVHGSSLNDLQRSESSEFLQSGGIQNHEFNSIMNAHYDRDHNSMNNITPSTTRSNHTAFDHQFIATNKNENHVTSCENMMDDTVDCVHDGRNEIVSEQFSSPLSNYIGSNSIASDSNIGSNFEQDIIGENNLDNSLPLNEDTRKDTNQHPEQLEVKQKKPFLKKGSRKEPSSLQKANKDVLKKGMRFNNDVKVDGHGSRKINTTEQDALAHLEQMQQEQLENLEKRIERRNKARLEIKRKRRESKSSSPYRKKEEMNRDESTTESDPNESEGNDDSSQSESDDDSESSMNKELNKENLDGDLKSHEEENNRRRKASAYKLNTHKNYSGRCSKTPPHQKNKVFNGKGKGTCKVDFKSPELKEQWQVIKSMRKRQEAALRAAEKEREEAKMWANNERQSVQKWAEQQRALIQKEKKRITNEILTAQRKKRQESLEERAAAASESSQKQLRSEVEALSETLQKQKIDSDATKSRFRLNEKKLKDTISDKNNQIASLKVEIENLNVKYSEAKIKIDELSHLRISAKKKKKKKNPKTKCEQSQKNMKSNNTMSPEEPKIEEQDDNECQVSSSLEEQKVINDTKETKCDEEAIAVIKRGELIKEPEEEWLCKHIQGIDDDKVDSKEHKKRMKVVCTPTKDKRYDPLQYTSTPKTTVDLDDYSSKKGTLKTQNNNTNNINYVINNDSRVIKYDNGTKKEILPDGSTIIRFSNGDVKTTYSTKGIVVYYYSDSKTSHTTHPDGLEIYEFASGQTERHYPNGRKEVCFPDGTQQTFLPNGDKMNRYPDGVHVMESHMGQKVINQSFDQCSAQNQLRKTE